MSRQKLRKLLLFLSFLFFPLTFLYFSPVMIIEAALEGIINGSFIVFIIMFIGSIFFGRAFCAYVCPGGGLQECAFIVNDKRPKQGRKNYIKYCVWAVWVLVIIFSFIYKGQISGIDFFWGEAQNGIARIFSNATVAYSVIFNYSLFYVVIFCFVLSSLLGGKRAFCHYFCWMAPFMALGIKLRNLLHWRGLYIETKGNECISCKKCSNACPMCIDVEAIVKSNGNCGGIYSLECIQCGACVDICPKKTLRFSIGRTDKKQ